MLLIPTYRAKSNERKNTYVEGLLIGIDEELNLCTIRTKDDYIGGEICYLHTLSINFPDIIDREGNKIFASLQEDGKGGDIIETELKRVCTVKYKEYFFYADNKDYHCNCFGFIHSKIIGIQQ